MAGNARESKNTATKLFPNNSRTTDPKPQAPLPQFLSTFGYTCKPDDSAHRVSGKVPVGSQGTSTETSGALVEHVKLVMMHEKSK